MDIYRFYVPDLGKQVEGVGGVVTLPEDQGHHARSVLRLRGGEMVVLFDGGGLWAEGKVAGAVDKKGGVRVQVEGDVRKDALPALRLTIATAVPKGERAEWLVEQASQLNAWRVQWLASDRGVVKPAEGGGKMEKWRRLAIESAKQCGRTHVMGVEAPRSLDEVLAVAGAGNDGGMAGVRRLWLDPHGGKTIAEAMKGFGAGEVMALVGPEGGWSEGETRLLEALAGAGKVERVRLTETVLRIETACTAIAAMIMGGGWGRAEGEGGISKRAAK